MSEYNGWTNYETWCVNLWLSNDSNDYNTVKDICRGGKDYDAAQRLKEFVEELQPDLEASMFSDLLNAAISEVNWMEVAQAFREEEEKEEEGEEGEEEAERFDGLS